MDKQGEPGHLLKFTQRRLLNEHCILTYGEQKIKVNDDFTSGKIIGDCGIMGEKIANAGFYSCDSSCINACLVFFSIATKCDFLWLWPLCADLPLVIDIFSSTHHRKIVFVYLETRKWQNFDGSKIFAYISINFWKILSSNPIETYIVLRHHPLQEVWIYTHLLNPKKTQIVYCNISMVVNVLEFCVSIQYRVSSMCFAEFEHTSHSLNSLSRNLCCHSW